MDCRINTKEKIGGDDDDVSGYEFNKLKQSSKFVSVG